MISNQDIQIFSESIISLNVKKYKKYNNNAQQLGSFCCLKIEEENYYK